MDRIMTIAESKEIAEFLINKYNLYDHYDIDSTGRKAAFKVMEHFQSLYDVERTKFNAIEISIEDKDKFMAADMINDAWMQINNMGQALIKAGQRTELNTRIKTVEEKAKKLTILNDSLTFLRKKYGIYNAPTQSSYLTSLITKYQGTLDQDQEKRKVYASKGVRYRDSVIVTDARIEGAQAQILLHEEGLNKFNEGMAIVEALQRVHKESSEQYGTNRERQSQLESTLKNEFTAIYLVSKGEVSLDKSRPKRSILMVAAVFIAFLFSVIGVLLIESYRSVNWKEVLHD